MQKQVSKKSWLVDPFLTIVLLYSIVPLVPQLISQTLTTYFYMFVVLWTIFIVVIERKEESINAYLPVLLPFLLFNLISYLFKRDSVVIWGYKFFLAILPPVMGYYVTKERQDILGGLGRLMLVLLIISGITTIIGLIRYPMAARVLATIGSSQDPTSVKYNWNNIGGYDFIYTIVLLYPLVILAWKKKKINLFFALVLTVGIFAMVILSEYTIALLLTIITTTLYFVPATFSKKGLIIMTVLGIFAIIVLWGPISEFLKWLADVLESEVVGERLDGIAGGSEGLEGLDDKRMDLYKMSIESFFKSPLFGMLFYSVYPGIGGHSELLDLLAKYGVGVLILLVFVYRSIYKYFLKEHSNKLGFGFVIWFFIQAILLSILNTGLWLLVLCLYGPIFINMIFKEKEK